MRWSDKHIYNWLAPYKKLQSYFDTIIKKIMNMGDTNLWLRWLVAFPLFFTFVVTSSATLFILFVLAVIPQTIDWVVYTTITLIETTMRKWGFNFITFILAFLIAPIAFTWLTPLLIRSTFVLAKDNDFEDNNKTDNEVNTIIKDFKPPKTINKHKL